MFRLSLKFVLFFVAALAPATAVAQTSGQPAVGIFQIEDLAQTGASETFSTMIETAIASTGRFRVIERERIGRLVAEQARARSGLVTSRNRGRVGGFEGVDFLIYGTITSVSMRARTNVGSSLLGGVLSGLSGSNGNVHCANQAATLAVDIRITDADSGEVRYVSRIEETQRVASVCNGQSQIDTPRLLRSAAERISGALVTTIYPIQIAAVQGDGTIILNYGDGTIAPGAILSVFSRGMPIRDPATNQVIGHDETKLGYLRVSEVTARMSRAAAVGTFATPPQVGAIVRPASEEEIRAMNRNDRRGRRNNR
jgi:curli biogenesis system outer membrane secretion channel CsgG